MSDYEYEEQNLDDFLIKSSQILTSEGNNEEKEIIIESLKQHLSEIFNNQSELQNFYKTLNIVIFKDNSGKLTSKIIQCEEPIFFIPNCPPHLKSGTEREPSDVRKVCCSML